MDANTRSWLDIGINFVLLNAGIIAGGHSIVVYFLLKRYSGRRALGGFLFGVFLTLFALPGLWGGGFPVPPSLWRMYMSFGELVGAVILFSGYVGERTSAHKNSPPR